MSAINNGNAVCVYPIGTGSVPPGNDFANAYSSMGNKKRALGDKFAESVSVKDYGAVGDGISDDTTAITNAIAATTSGKTLLFPPAVYRVSSSLIFNISNARFFSTSGVATIKPIDGATGIALARLSASNLWFENIEFDGNSLQNTLIVFSTSASVSITNVQFRGCVFRNTTSYGCAAFAAGSLTSILWDTCVFRDFLSTAPTPPAAIQIVQPSVVQDIAVLNSRFTNLTGTGFSVRASNGAATPAAIRFSNNYCNHGTSTYTTIGAEIYGRDATISGNVFEDARMGLSLVALADSVISNNSFSNHSSYNIEAAGLTNVAISGNSFKDFLFGIEFDRSSDNVAVVGNVFASAKDITANQGWAVRLNVAYTFNNVSICNNNITTCAGIRADNCTGLTVCGNTMRSLSSATGDCRITTTTASSNASICNNSYTTAADISSASACAISIGHSNATVQGNIVRSTTGSANIGIAIGNTAGIALNSVLISNNIVVNWSTGINTNNGSPTNTDVRVTDNVALSCTTPTTVTAAEGVRSRQLTTRSAVPTAGTYAVGDQIFNSTPSIATPLGWQCTTAGTPGTWTMMGQLNPFQQSNQGDAALTVTPYTTRPVIVFNVPITADRAVTLGTTGAVNGLLMIIVRSTACTGAFNIDVGGLKTLTAAGQWCIIGYQGPWRLLAYGTL